MKIEEFIELPRFLYFLTKLSGFFSIENPSVVSVEGGAEAGGTADPNPKPKPR